MQLHWHTEPLLLITLLLFGWLYAIAIGPLRKAIDPNAQFSLTRAISFYLGLIITYIAVGSPLDQIGEQFLFSAHMVQHMLLIYITPTLFFVGIPNWLIDWLLRADTITQVFNRFTHPACGGLLFTFVYTAWHVPGLYEAALHDKRIHILEHWTMFCLGCLMLWPFLTTSLRVPKRSYPLRILTIFLLMVGQLPVFAFLTFANEAIYPTYVWAPRIINLDPLNDQILGGVIMKIVNMGFSLSILVSCFYYWSRSEANDDPIVNSTSFKS